MKHPLAAYSLEALFAALQPGESLELHRSAEDDALGCVSLTCSSLTISRRFDMVEELQKDSESPLFDQALKDLRTMRKGVES